MFHIKYKNKISYSGERISILPWQMAEQLAVEVNVKNVTEHTGAAAAAGQAHLFCLDIILEVRALPSSSCGGHWGALWALIGGPSGPYHLTK